MKKSKTEESKKLRGIGFSMTAVPISSRPDNCEMDGYHYSITLSRGEGSVHCFYTCGDGWIEYEHGRNVPIPPQLSDVVYSLFDSDVPDDFEDFCDDFGYDSDSRKAKKTWKACRKMAKMIEQSGIFVDRETIQEIMQGY